uniref:Uncharacterized protein n=1 Tax=Arundo donax TaxID=35708 RepID=A0A0A9EQ06_ARUDO
MVAQAQLICISTSIATSHKFRLRLTCRTTALRLAICMSTSLQQVYLTNQKSLSKSGQKHKNGSVAEIF